MALRDRDTGSRAGKGRRQLGELATTSLEFEFRLQFPVAPRRLSCQISANEHKAETSTNVNKHGKTRESTCQG